MHNNYVAHQLYVATFLNLKLAHALYGQYTAFEFLFEALVPVVGQYHALMIIFGPLVATFPTSQ